MMKYDDIRIRKVKGLSYRARDEADRMGLSDDDMVIVRTYHDFNKSPLPFYELEKIVGSPINYLLSKLEKMDKEIESLRDTIKYDID